MKAQGIFAVVFIFGMALAMSGYSVWHHFQQARRIRVFWGPEIAQLIRHAPQVELCVLKQPSAASATESKPEMLEVKSSGGEVVSFAVERRLDISAARGLVHSRHSLIIDDGFVWEETVQADEPRWEFAERFVDGENVVTLLYDFRSERVRMIEGGKEIRLTPWLAKGMKDFFAELLSPPEK